MSTGPGWRVALYSAACAAVDSVAPPPRRTLPEPMPAGLAVEVYQAELLRRLRLAGDSVGFRAPLRVTGEAIANDPRDALAVAVAIADPSEVWLVAGRLHFFADDGARAVEAAFRPVGRAWESTSKLIGRTRAVSAGVMVWRGA